MGNQPGLSDAEREVLKVLWDQGPGTVREMKRGACRSGPAVGVHHRGNLAPAAADQGVRDGGIIGCCPTSTRPTSPREQLLDRRLKDAAEELCDGQAAPLILALVQGNRFSAEELERMRQMLDEAASKRNRRKAGRDSVSSETAAGPSEPSGRSPMLWWFAETTLVAVVLACVAALCGRLPRIGPTARHVLWLVVLIKLVTPPVVQSPWSVSLPGDLPGLLE